MAMFVWVLLPTPARIRGVRQSVMCYIATVSCEHVAMSVLHATAVLLAGSKFPGC